MRTSNVQPESTRRSIQEAVSSAASCGIVPDEPWADARTADLVEHMGLIPTATVERKGERTVLGEGSPGCECCHGGQWDCIFLTMACNLDCRFCLRPNQTGDFRAGSVFGNTPEQVSEAYSRVDVQGVSFSGGEALLESEALFHWLDVLVGDWPEKYYWIYTNGTIGSDTTFERLSAAGVREMRFNAAATGYTAPGTLERMRAAARHLDRITVEIPAIPADEERLMDALEVWDALGVRHLNLHELIHQGGSNSGTMSGGKEAFEMPDGHGCHVGVRSRELTCKVMERVYALGLSMSVNDCAMQSKVAQMRGRRRLLADFAREPFEVRAEGGILQSVCVAAPEGTMFVHPADYSEMDPYKDCPAALVSRSVGLDPRRPSQWVGFVPIAGT